MLRAQDLMTTDVLTLHPDTTLRDAISALSERHVSGAPVTDGGRVIGVISGNGILEYAASLPGVPKDRPGSREAPADEWEAPSEWNADDESPAMYFSEYWPDEEASVVERMRESESAEWDVLEENTVSDAMSRTICGVRPDTPLNQAAEFMKKMKVHRLLVMQDGNLAGILSTMDITRAVAEGRLTSRTYVFDRRR